MRSRDGNSSFSFRLLASLLFSISLNAQEYLISYRYVVKDAIIYNESLLVSKTMKKCRGNTYQAIILENDGSKDLKEIISKNDELFREYIHKIGLNVKHDETTKNHQNKSTTILTLKTKCFKVDINDNFAKIAPLK